MEMVEQVLGALAAQGIVSAEEQQRIIARAQEAQAPTRAITDEIVCGPRPSPF